MPQFTRHFFDDEKCVKSLSAVSSQSAVEKLQSKDKQFVLASHKADLWRYADMYEHGGVYLDMKIAVLQPLHGLLLEKQGELLEMMIEKGQGQVQPESKGQAHAQERPSKPECLPFFLAAIGASGDHIFQGTIVCPKRHPLMVEALLDASLTDKDQMKGKGQYLKFCKYLYGLIEKSSETGTVQPGWNNCGRFGWVYLLKEKKQKRDTAFLVTKTKRNVMGTFWKMLQRIRSNGLQRDAGAGTMAFKVIQEPLCGFCKWQKKPRKQPRLSWWKIQMKELQQASAAVLKIPNIKRTGFESLLILLCKCIDYKRSLDDLVRCIQGVSVSEWYCLHYDNLFCVS